MGILGGSFDPVHDGHLRLALEVLEQLSLDVVKFIPCRQHVLKTHSPIDSKHRLAMLRLALQHSPQFEVDERELNRNTPSYMLDTLKSLHEEDSTLSLNLIIGNDVAANFHEWHAWKEIFNYAHVIIATRPGYDLNSIDCLKEESHRIATTKQALIKKPSGHIFLVETSRLDIASTQIRHRIRLNQSAQFLIPETVREYIDARKLYRG